jgi:hypothetical protein
MGEVRLVYTPLITINKILKFFKKNFFIIKLHISNIFSIFAPVNALDVNVITLEVKK